MVVIEDDGTYVLQDPEYYEIIEEDFKEEIHDNALCASLFYQVKQEILNTLDIVHVVQLGELSLYSEQFLKSTSQKGFNCSICFKSFQYKSKLNRHKKMHMEEDFKISDFSSFYGIKNHAEETKLSAEVKDEINNKGQIKEDKISMIKKGKFSCNESKLNRHKKMHMEEDFKISDVSSFCGIKNNAAETKLSAEVKDEINNKGQIKEDKISMIKKGKFSCNECGRTFEKRYKFLEHTRTHTGEFEPLRFQCSICNKQISTKRDLEVHIRTHTGEKPFSCEICGRSFTQGSNLRRHRRVHTGEPALYQGQEIKCDICGRSFGQPHQLTRHMKIHFPATNPRKYKCDQCPKEFTEKHHLVRHVRVHTGEKPYKCDFCDMRFTFHASYTSHRRLHTKEKPYTCKLCDKSFAQLTTMNYHMTIHSGDPRYKCKTCQQKFSKQRLLKEHKEQEGH